MVIVYLPAVTKINIIKHGFHQTKIGGSLSTKVKGMLLAAISNKFLFY